MNFYGNSFKDWLLALIILFAVSAFFKALHSVFLKRLALIAKKTETELDDLALSLLEETKFFLPLSLALYLATVIIILPEQATQIIRSLVIISALIQCGIWGNGLIAFSTDLYAKKHAMRDPSHATAINAIRMIGRIVVWSFILLLCLENLGIDITALVAGLGIGGIAVALAAQNILGDLFASLSIVLDKPFVIGDSISVGEFQGTIEYIGLKTTRIRSLSGEQIIFSNTDLLQSRVRNFKLMNERRVLFALGVTYSTPYEKLAAIPGIIRAIIESHPQTRFDRAHFKEYGDSALVLEAVYYVQNADFNIHMDIRQSINLKIYESFKNNEIEFAYPTQTIFVHKTNGR